MIIIQIDSGEVFMCGLGSQG